MHEFPAGYFVRVVCSGVNGQEELGAWVPAPATLVGLSGGDGNLQVILLARLVGREAAPGENTFRVLTVLSQL